MPKRSLVHSTESPPRLSQVQAFRKRNANGDWQDGQVSWLRFIIPCRLPKAFAPVAYRQGLPLQWRDRSGFDRIPSKK